MALGARRTDVTWMVLALLSSVVPARPAASVQPVIALRADRP
jgi:ABC-type lipoprotein release transport system permease subunit